jgi:hypothetical protein
MNAAIQKTFSTARPIFLLAAKDDHAKLDGNELAIRIADAAAGFGVGAAAIMLIHRKGGRP